MNTAMAKLRVRKRYNYAGLLYISPWIIGMLVFQLYPFIASLVYSFTTFSILTPPKFVGLQNFIRIFTNDKIFYQSLKVTLIYVFIAVPAKLAFALFIAMVLNIKIKYVNFYRTIYYMPSILGGSVAVSILWKFLFARQGLINQLLLDIGLPYVDWLGSPKWALYTISLLTVWQFGSSMVIFLAGLKQIPGELYDAAKVDGAGRIRTFLNITLPLITPMIFFNLIMQMVNAFQQFTAAFVITNGGPMKSTYLYGVMIYENAFNFFKMGYASALSWVLFVIMMAFTAMVFKSSPFWTHYEDGGEF